MSHRALKSVQSFFLYRTARKKRREGKERHTKSRRRYISVIRGESPRERIFTKFCMSRDMPDLVICGNFDVKKLRGLGYTGDQIFGAPLKWLVTLTSAALRRSL